MNTVNLVILLGRVTRDIELRHTPGKGTAVAEVGIATDRRKPDGKGGYETEPVFTDVVFWGRSAEVVAQYVKKGHLLSIQGELQQVERTVHAGTDKERKERKTKVVAREFQLLPQREKSGTGTPSRPTPPADPDKPASYDSGDEIDF